MYVQRRMPHATLASILLHLFFFGWLYIFKDLFPTPVSPPKAGRTIKVESISPEMMKKYRTVGVKGGSKKFMMKTPKGSPVRKKENSKAQNNQQAAQEKGQKDSKGLSLKELQAKVKPEDLPQSPDVKKSSRSQEEARKNFKQKQNSALITKEIQKAESGVPLTALRSDQAVENFRRQNSMKRNMLREMGTNSTRAEVLSRTGFNLHFEPPEGVSEDELNSVEKIFYSFQKRTFVTYVNSFVSTYQQELLNKPQLANALRNERHLLTGKIEFDREGNILRIKILRSSQSDEVHELFEETLKGIQALPNPPKALIEKNDQFTIYYQLNINY